jgi:hypothetical protein
VILPLTWAIYISETAVPEARPAKAVAQKATTAGVASRTMAQLKSMLFIRVAPGFMG